MTFKALSNLWSLLTYEIICLLHEILLPFWIIILISSWVHDGGGGEGNKLINFYTLSLQGWAIGR